MRNNIIILILAFIGICEASTAQESLKADSSLTRKNTNEVKNITKQSGSTETIISGESKSSGVVRPEPVIIYKDEEKTLVKPQ